MGGVALGEVVGSGGPGGVEAQGGKLNGVGAEVAVELVEGGHQAIAFALSTTGASRHPCTRRG